MNSKKYVLTFLIALLPFACWAEDISIAAKAFRSNIQNFLREEGFAPTIDNEGSLCFKKEGTAYWIDVIGDKPFYVIFHRDGIGTKDANALNVMKAINDVNTNIRAIKCCYMGDYVALSIESYCYLAEDFRYVFYNYLSILEAANEAVKEAYAKYDSNSSANSQSSLTIGSVERKQGNKIYISSPIAKSEYHSWWVNSIELNSYNTIVHKTVVPKITESYVCATNDEYIEDCDTGKKYYIQSSTIGISPQRTTLYSKNAKSFSDTYPALPASVKRISIWSGSEFYVKNLQIR